MLFFIAFCSYIAYSFGNITTSNDLISGEFAPNIIWCNYDSSEFVNHSQQYNIAFISNKSFDNESRNAADEKCNTIKNILLFKDVIDDIIGEYRDEVETHLEYIHEVLSENFPVDEEEEEAQHTESKSEWDEEEEKAQHTESKSEWDEEEEEAQHTESESELGDEDEEFEEEGDAEEGFEEEGDAEEEEEELEEEEVLVTVYDNSTLLNATF
jgi:hypothetical protein